MLSSHDLSVSLHRHCYRIILVNILIRIAYGLLCLSARELITRTGMMMRDPSCCFLRIDSSLHHRERHRELSVFFLIIAWLLGVAWLARFLQHPQKVLSTSDVHPVDLQSCTTNTNRSDIFWDIRRFFTTSTMQGMTAIMQEIPPYEQIMGKILSVHDAPNVTSH